MGETFLQTLSARLAEQKTPARLFAPLAALLVLRWADQQESEQETLAALDDTPFTPALVPGSRFRDFCDLRGPALAAALIGQVAPGIARSRDTGAGALVRRIEPVLGSIVALNTETIGALVEDVQNLPIATVADREQALDAFDSALDRFYDARRDGRFLTPHPVVELVVELASPRPGERIYDPCFGIATILAACARRVRKQIRAGRPDDLVDVQRGAFLGVEINQEAFVIGLARMILAGVDRPALELGNALERPLPKDRVTEGFDCIVAEPPFGARLLTDAAGQFPVKATSSEALFLQHIAASLRPGGRAVVVLPQGAFFRGGADAAVRRLLLDEYDVEAVVSLPQGMYLPYSNVRTGVLVFRREPPSGHVYFVNAEEPIGEVVRAEPGAPPFDPAALARSALGRGSGYSLRDASVEELKQDGATLMPPRRDGPLAAFVQAVRAADPSVPVRPLEEVADLFAGLRTKSGDIATGAVTHRCSGCCGPRRSRTGRPNRP